MYLLNVLEDRINLAPIICVNSPKWYESQINLPKYKPSVYTVMEAFGVIITIRFGVAVVW
jgi:hypothetical protein